MYMSLHRYGAYGRMAERVFLSKLNLFIFISFLAFLLTFWSFRADAAEKSTTQGEVTCACEDLPCKPCESETNVTFYTSKCGPKNSRVKSCKKPTCEPVTNQEQCLADLKKGGSTAAALAVAAPAMAPAETKEARKLSIDPVGIVTNAAGNGKLVLRAGGAEVKIYQGLNVHEGDAIDTSDGGKVRVAFKDKNVLNVAPGTRVTVDTQIYDPAPGGQRKTLLNLMYGKIRTKVNKENRYDGAQNSFQIKTKVAVAGVRGTDFVTIFEPGDKKWVTEVRTLEGTVEFGGDELNQTIPVTGGNAATFSINAPAGAEITNAQLRSYIEKGELSQTRAMGEGEVRKTDAETDYKDLKSTSSSTGASVRQPTSAEDEIVCTQPDGKFRQCSLTCQAKASNSKCAVCVRRVCDAGGKWADTTVLPKSYADFCDVSRIQVKDWKDCGEH